MALAMQMDDEPVGGWRFHALKDGCVLSVHKNSAHESYAYLDQPQDLLWRIFVDNGARFGPPLLPPYPGDHVEAFERVQQITLPALLRFYVTRISREFVLPRSRRTLVFDSGRQLGFNRLRTRGEDPTDCYFGDDVSLQQHVRDGTLELGEHDGIVSVVLRGHTPGLALWSRDDRREYGTGSLLDLFLLAGM